MRSAFSLLILAALTGIWPSLHAQSVELVDANPLLRVETGRHSAPVRRLSVSESRGLAVTASDDKTARVWDLRTGQQGMALRPPIGHGEIGRLYGAAIHPTQPLVAVGGTAAPNGKHGTIYMFDLESGRIVRSVDSGIGDIKRITWSADGTVLLVGFSDPGAIRAFSVQGRSLFDEPTEGPVYGIAAGPRGLIAATDFAGRVVLLRAVDGLVKRLTAWPVTRSEPWGVAISPDEATLAVGYRQPLAGPELIEASSGRIVRRLQPRGAVEGNFGVVAYGQDGRTIAVGGSGSASGHRFPVWIFDADDGHQREVVEVASNSVLDLVGLRGGRFGYTSFDGSWGVVGQRVELHIASGVNDLRGPSNLAASADLRRVGWAFDYGGGRATFDLSRRVIEGPVSGLATALTRRTLLDTPLEAGIGARGVARTRSSAQVNGVTISFTGVELASCGTYLHATRDAILGTTRALYRIDGNGHELWRVPTAAEVDAVVASDDDRLLVTAMSDGLIQWRRAVDGAELLSMLASRDGRWIIWTPEGYFDASPGADALAGWVVNRGADSSAEFFSLGRFRDRYHRPDVIDNVLNTLDTHQAIEQARPTARPSLLTIEPGSTLDVATASLAPLVEAPPPVEQFPPTLVALGGRRLQASGPDVQIPFALRSVETGEPPQIEVRLEGRPAATKRIDMPGKLDGSAQGLITVDLGAGSSSSIVLVARNASGVSEPLSFEIDLLPPAPTTKPKGIAVEQQSASAAASALAAPPTTAGFSASASAANEAVPKAQMPTASPASTTSVARPSSDLPAIGPPAAVPERVAVPPSAPVASTAPLFVPTPHPASALALGTNQEMAAARVRPIKPGPTLYLLAVGISEYERTEYRLGFPAKDATDFAHEMAMQKGRLYGDVVARVLTNSRAHRQAVLDGLRWLAEAVGPSDVGMLFLAGHGVNEHAGQYYFMGYDARSEQIRKTGVAERDIRDALKRIRGRALFFVDTCFAGNVIGDPRNSSRELSRLASSLASAENGAVVFAASSGRQESEENTAWGNGAFTKALVEGLRGRADLNKAGRITFKGLDFFISEEVRRLTNGRQTPVTLTPLGVPDFAVASST